MIRLEKIYKSYGAIKVLAGMDMQVEAGKSLCILGKSGCGKSTILKLIALMMRPDQGALYIDGNDAAKMTNPELDATRREKIAYTFQEPLLIPYATALENVTLVTGARRKDAVELLNKLGLGDRLNQRPPKLSGGEKKRVDIARAVLKNSTILVADEPLSNLDPEAGEKVMGLLKAHAERGGILVYSSVEPSETRYASQVVNMEKN